MRSKEDKIRAADDKLLKRETYYRRARRAELGIGIVILLTMIARFSRSPETMPQDQIVSYWILMMVFFASSWLSDAKIRHIESIKVNRKETGEIPTQT